MVVVVMLLLYVAALVEAMIEEDANLLVLLTGESCYPKNGFSIGSD